MQSAQLQALSESPLAAKPQLSEKPRLGFESKKTTGKPGSSVCNFTVTLGLRATVVENGVRKTYSARYYNPATGRFLSRDTNEGQRRNPMSLHKYLYANGDPINRIDPFGREAMLEVGSLDAIIGTTSVPALVELAGGTAAQIAAWANTLNAGIALIYDLLSEAAAEEAASQFSAAWQVWSESAAAYNELLLETSAQGGITRLFSCTTLGIVYGIVIDEYDSLHPWKGWLAETGATVGCELNFIVLVE